MGCKCAERRAAIAQGARAVVRGDAEQLVEQAQFVVSSTVEDVSALFRGKVAAARARLAGR